MRKIFWFRDSVNPNFGSGEKIPCLLCYAFQRNSLAQKFDPNRFENFIFGANI
jgi:hypothetical protein